MRQFGMMSLRECRATVMWQFAFAMMPEDRNEAKRHCGPTGPTQSGIRSMQDCCSVVTRHSIGRETRWYGNDLFGYR